MSGSHVVTIVIEQGEQGWVVASIPEVPGANSQGRTREEARANVSGVGPRLRQPGRAKGRRRGVYAGSPSLSFEVFGRHRGGARFLGSCGIARLDATGDDI